MEDNKIKSKDVYFDENYFLGVVDEKDYSLEKKYFVLIIYDISENKRRNNMVKILNKYGFRVQKSAFEAIIRPNKYKKLLNELKRIPDTNDSVRVYKIQGKGTVEVFGKDFSIEDENLVII